jgi:hypothetical protein
MSNTEKRNLKTRKLSLSRETLRTLSAEGLEGVIGGGFPQTIVTCRPPPPTLSMAFTCIR